MSIRDRSLTDVGTDRGRFRFRDWHVRRLDCVARGSWCAGSYRSHVVRIRGPAYRICRAGNLAILVDADHGYGNALNVMRTVEELETVGVCAASIEDTELPQPFGSVGTPRMLSIEEGAGKMKAAVEARQDRNL